MAGDENVETLLAHLGTLASSASSSAAASTSRTIASAREGVPLATLYALRDELSAAREDAHRRKSALAERRRDVARARSRRSAAAASAASASMAAATAAESSEAASTTTAAAASGGSEAQGTTAGAARPAQIATGDEAPPLPLPGQTAVSTQHLSLGEAPPLPSATSQQSAATSNGATTMPPSAMDIDNEDEEEDEVVPPRAANVAAGASGAGSGQQAPVRKRKRANVIDSDDDQDGEGDEDDEDDAPLANQIQKRASPAPGAGAMGTAAASGSVPPPPPHKLRRLDGETPSRSATPAAVLAPAKPTVVVEEPVVPEPHREIMSSLLRLDDRFAKHAIPIKPPAPNAATDFALPERPLAPPPPVPLAIAPTPKRQADVSQDFSKAKPGNQIAFNTFHTWADAYLRPFGEDDLGFLAPTQDDARLYEIPPLGRHYTEVWEDDDHDAYGTQSSSRGGQIATSSLAPPPLQRIRPERITEDSIATEDVYLGPLGERLIAALEFDSNTDVDKRYLEHKQESLSALYRANTDSLDLEERIKRELHFVGLIEEEEPDWSNREDDEISASLRACQRLLRQQTGVNEARKSVLMGIVRDRMAFQEYDSLREAMERAIEAGWTKRTRQPKKQGKQKKSDRASNAANGADQQDGPKAPVSMSLLTTIDRRRRFIDAMKPFFEQDEQEAERYFKLPSASVFQGTAAAEPLSLEAMLQSAATETEHQPEAAT